MTCWLPMYVCMYVCMYVAIHTVHSNLIRMETKRGRMLKKGIGMDISQHITFARVGRRMKDIERERGRRGGYGLNRSKACR